MTKNPTDKLAAKRQALIARTARALRVSEQEATALLHTRRAQSLRLNPLKGEPDATVQALTQLGWRGVPYPWMPLGFTNETPLALVRDSVMADEGKVFIQNAASWLPVLALNPQPGESILDMCAAPGGKTSHIAALTDNRAVITANDNSRIRLNKLIKNLEHLGAANIETTLFDATQLAIKLSGRLFDKILLDAPCSGEGLMQLDNPKDFDTWSVAHIKRLQQLQKRLISQAWQLLKPGGSLVYSTCTMAPEENEAVINYLLRRHPEARVEAITTNLPNRVNPVSEWNGKPFDTQTKHCLRLQPSTNIEAFFVCKLTKN